MHYAQIYTTTQNDKIMTTDLLSAIAYSVNTAVCVTIGIVLLCSESIMVAPGKKDTFCKAKRYFGISAFVEAFVCLLTLLRICSGVEYMSLNYFFVPLFFYFGLCIDITAILILLHSPKLTWHTTMSFVAPIVVIWLVHIISFVSSNGITFDAGVYKAFLENTMAGLVTRWMLYAVMTIEGIVSLVYVSSQSRRFKERIDNFFIGYKRQRSMWIIYLIVSITLYYILYIGDLFVYDRKADMWIMVLKVLFTLFNTVSIVNTRYLFWAIKPAFDETLNMQRADSHQEVELEMREIGNSMPSQPFSTVAQSTVVDDASADNVSQKDNTAAINVATRSIDNIINEWIERDDKPYLKESVTIMQVAEEMGINARLLSKYINNVKGKNFNTWINEMKVAEVKHMLVENPLVTMAELAYETGFTDLPAMSKVFKSIVGVPPSVYRQQLQTN